MSNLAFFEAATPYWIDFHNDLSNNGFKVYYIYSDYEAYCKGILSKLSFTPGQLKPGHKNSWRIKELYHLIRENDPEIVISTEYSLLTVQLLLIKLIAAKKYRLVTRCDDSFEMIEKPLTRMHKWSSKIMSRMVDDVILCDYKSYTYYRQQKGKGIYFPIVSDDVTFRRELELSLPIANQLREKYSLKDKTVLLFVGRLVPVKNIGLLFKALQAIDNDKIVVVIVGSGQMEDVLRKESTECNKQALFVGNQLGLDLKAWYNIADLFVLPSYHETFGAVVGESLMAGCFSLITEKAGSSHLIEPGSNGLLFNPNNVDDLRLKISQSLQLIPSSHSLDSIRPSLMVRTYREYFDAFFTGLKDYES